jgi:hypothetical protein
VALENCPSKEEGSPMKENGRRIKCTVRAVSVKPWALKMAFGSKEFFKAGSHSK